MTIETSQLGANCCQQRYGRMSGSARAEQILGGTAPSGNLNLVGSPGAVGVLPGRSRLLAVWSGTDSATSPLEHATNAMITMWRVYLTDLDNHAAQRWPEQDFLPCDALALRSSIARVIDDEVTWQIRQTGNREAAVLIDDDHPEIVTVGELLGQITMLTVLTDAWPGESPPALPIPQAWDQYESLAADLAAGNRRQPRRRSHGTAPTTRPRLGPTPHPVIPG